MISGSAPATINIAHSLSLSLQCHPKKPNRQTQHVVISGSTVQFPDGQPQINGGSSESGAITLQSQICNTVTILLAERMCSIHKSRRCLEIGPCADFGCATIRPTRDFNPEKDCHVLHEATQKASRNDQVLINLLTKRSISQRLLIRKLYSDLYGKDLAAGIKSLNNNSFGETLVEMLEDPAVLDAHWLHKSIQGMGTNEELLTEILATRNPVQMRAIREAYQREYKSDLVKDIIGDTSGGYKLVCTNLVSGNRQQLNADQMESLARFGHDSIIDRASAVQAANVLFTTTNKKMGTAENPFINVITTANIYQLRAIYLEYNKMSTTDLLQTVRSIPGDLGQGLGNVLLAQINRPRYFADRLHLATKKTFGCDEKTLVRVLLTRCQVDLLDVMLEYSNHYGKSLETTITANTSGNLGKLLLGLIQGN